MFEEAYLFNLGDVVISINLNFLYSVIPTVCLYCSQSTGGCRSASSAGTGAVTVASAGAGAGAGACAARMASAGAQYRGGAQQWAAAYAPQPCRYPPPQPQPYAATPSPYTPHQVNNYVYGNYKASQLHTSEIAGNSGDCEVMLISSGAVPRS